MNKQIFVKTDGFYYFLICNVCKKEFKISKYEYKRGQGIYCSRECSGIGRTGLHKYNCLSKHGNWKGGILISSNGYRLIKMNGHHLANHSGYVLEHRLIAEKIIGRKLMKHEQIHHVNGNRLDNRPENILVLTINEHSKLHNILHKNQ